MNPSSNKWTVALAGLVVFLYWVSLYIYFPTLPAFVQTRTTNLAVVGAILSMYGLWQAITRLPLGLSADRFGHKPIIVGGLFLASLGAVSLGYAPSTGMMYLGRSLNGLAASAWVVLVVVFCGYFPPSQAVRATAALTLIASVARILATGLTGTLNTLGGYTLAFVLAGVLGLIGAGLALALPVHQPKGPPISLPVAGKVLTRPDVLLPSLLNTVNQFMIWAVPMTMLPILAVQLGAQGQTLSLLFSTSILVGAIGNLTAASVANRVGTPILVALSFIFLGGGTLVAASTSSLWVVAVLYVVIGLGQGIGYPVLMGLSIEKVEGSARATAMGLHQALYAVGMFAGPWLGGLMAEAWGLPRMFLLVGSVGVAVGLAGARLLSSYQAKRKAAAQSRSPLR
jgi:MFS family permease